MPIAVEYSPEKYLLYCRPSVDVTVEDFDRCLGQIVNSSDYPPDISTIWFTSELDPAAFGRKMQDAIIRLREKYPERGKARVAIVAERPVAFGLGRVYQGHSMALEQQIRVFQDVQSAEEWITKPK